MQHTALCKVRGVLHCGQVVGKQKRCSAWLLQLCSIVTVIASSLVLNTLSSAEPPNPLCCCLCSRQVRRRMEEENRKARRSKRKEYNDTMRELVAFVRKRVRGGEQAHRRGQGGVSTLEGSGYFRRYANVYFDMFEHVM